MGGVKSAKLKLARAAKHLRAIKHCIAKYAASKPHKIVLKAKRKKKINIPKGPPPELSLFIGEMVYQMRSTLDHLAFGLVQRNPNISTIDPKWRENTQFPIKTVLPKNCTTPLAKGRFSRDLPGISDKAFAIVELMQPYYGVGAINHSLGMLDYLSNIDKHRHLNLIRPRVGKHEAYRFMSGLSGRGYEALDRGAELEPLEGWTKADRPVYVKRSYRTFVAFTEREGFGEGIIVPVDYLLELILKHIRADLVPALEKLIKQP